MNHPRDMQRTDLAYWIRQGMVDCFAIDFLSDRAQDSIVNFLAAELERFYKEVKAQRNGDDTDWHQRMRWDRENMPFFEKATLRHPLGALFGETLAKAVDAACNPIFAELERGRKPERSI